MFVERDAAVLVDMTSMHISGLKRCLHFSSFPARKTGKGACFSFRVHTSPVFQFSSFSFVTSLFQFSQPECELENGKTGKRAPVFQFSQIESFLFPSRKTYRDSTSPSL